MPRYLIEVAYKGTAFKGFQSQPNQITVQGEVDRAIQTICRSEITSYPSSRTDAGVHAHQNFLHADIDFSFTSKTIYNLNAIVHPDIVIQHVSPVSDEFHARFDALARTYSYHIIQSKQPFLKETSYYFPFALFEDEMNNATALLTTHTDFTSFAKRHSDVFTHQCQIEYAYWERKGPELILHIKANRFLRGMVRAIVGTLLQVGRKKISISDFNAIILAQDCTLADFSAEAKGLFLERVHYPK